MNATDRWLRDYVGAFNHGAETGDFRAFLRLFAPDAVLTFDGVRLGPFEGRAAIGAAYRRFPPDDEIEILDSKVVDGEVVAGYSWLRTPDVRSGELRIRLNDDGLAQTVEIDV